MYLLIVFFCFWLEVFSGFSGVFKVGGSRIGLMNQLTRMIHEKQTPGTLSSHLFSPDFSGWIIVTDFWISRFGLGSEKVSSKNTHHFQGFKASLALSWTELAVRVFVGTWTLKSCILWTDDRFPTFTKIKFLQVWSFWDMPDPSKDDGLGNVGNKENS